jgi:hypothetical protein
MPRQHTLLLFLVLARLLLLLSLFGADLARPACH